MPKISDIMAPNPVELPSESLDILASEKSKYNFEWAPAVRRSKEAIKELPTDKEGLVLGSGNNSTTWHNRGWRTLDIDPESEANIIADANNLLESVEPESLDFIFAECITMDPKGKEGVKPEELIKQGGAALKKGGSIIVRTAHFLDAKEARTPDKFDLTGLMKKEGFRTVVETREFVKVPHLPNALVQPIVYYGEKL